MKQITFSIVTTTYNRIASGYLAECIQSIQKQAKGDYSYEHIIVDDGSSDTTEQFVADIAAADIRIKYIRQENAGPAKATQRGIAAAKAEYLIILDDDDALTPDSLKLRAEYIKAHPDVSWFYGLADWVDEYGLPTDNLFESRFFEEHLYERLLIDNVVSSGTPTLTLSAVREITWPDWLNRSQDYFLWLEMARPERNLKAGFINKSLVRYRYHNNNYSTKLNTPEKKRQKEELNFKIKALHPGQVAYLAKEAYTWLEEAHKTNAYWKSQFESQIRPLERKVAVLEDRLNGYRISRIIGPVIRVRDNRRRVQSFVLSLPKRVVLKALRTAGLYKPDRAKKIRYELVEKERLDTHLDAPLVSVITPYFNRNDTMPETIRSVLGQTMQSFEYIIVNDGSTQQEANEYIRKVKHPKIKVIDQANQGVAVARNTGIAAARGKYVICLDSDDLIEPTYIEKAVAVLESDPNIALVTFDTKMFGAKDEYYIQRDYDPLVLLEDNMVLTAALFKREAWERAGGYKDKIGYEDWEFWINIAEKGYFGRRVKEPLFKYRTAESSRYIDDLENHLIHTSYITNTHPDYRHNVKSILAERKDRCLVYKPEECFVNLNNPEMYKQNANGKPNVLIAIPWMTFGGAETLIYNFCKEVAQDFNISYMTGLDAENEWEYKFKEITPYVYHLANLFPDPKQYLEFMSNYIVTRKIEVLHIIHTSYVFDMLDELKQRHPGLKVVVTVFNDRAHFNESLAASKDVDVFTTDNLAVANKYKQKLLSLGNEVPVRVIPNGIDSTSRFNLGLYDRQERRKKLGLARDDIAVFFVGRLSEEKNPDVFLDVARRIVKKNRRQKVVFCMIGDGVMREELEKTMSEINSKRIKYLGYQSDIPKYLAAADIFVLPSSTEGFPLSILEAMAMNVAVISSRVGAVPDIIEHGVDGFVVKPGSAPEIAATIEQLADDPELLSGVKARSRKKVEKKYSNIILGDNYRSLYGSVLKDS